MYIFEQQTTKQRIMDNEQIKKLMASIKVFHSVYELQPVESDKAQDSREHTLILLEDFDNEEQAIGWILLNNHNYHSLTIIHRYE